MSKKSFDKFAYKGSIYYLEIIYNYAKENNNRIGKYKNNIFCPECKKARLKYVPKPAPLRGYLATIDLNEHLEHCSYKYKGSSYSTITRYKLIENLSSSEKRNQIEILLRHLSDSDIDKSYGNKNCSKDNRLRSERDNYNVDKRSNNTIQKFSLTNKIDLNALKMNSNLKMLYAKKVWLGYEERDGGAYYLPYIKNLAGEKLEIYFPIKNNELGKPGYYNIVCIGKINEFNKIQLDEPKKDSMKLEATN